MAHEELQSKADALSKETDELKLSLDAQKSLNNRLENDLLKLNGPNGKPPSPQPQERKDPLASLNLGKKVRLSPEALLRSIDGHRLQEIVSSGLNPAAESSILPIITSQRDRFRTRNAELEEVCLGLFALQDLAHDCAFLGTAKTHVYHLRASDRDQGSSS